MRGAYIKRHCCRAAHVVYRMNPFLDQHNIKPVIEKVYLFEQAVQAYEYLTGKPYGRVVIKVVD